MASALSTRNLSLLDQASRTDPTGKTARIVEMLNQRNSIVPDIPWVQGNLPTGHVTTVRTSLPTVSYRRLNAGSITGKSTSSKSEDQAAILEAFSEVDVKIANMNEDVGAFRLSESLPHIEAMTQKFTRTALYGNASVVGEEFTGLLTRYNALTGSGAAVQNTISAGGSAASKQASILVVVWGDQTVHGIFPKGSKAGLTHEDKNIVTLENANGVTGARLDVYRDKYTWEHGISVRDPRYIVRICNIDIPILIANSSPADISKFMFQAYERIQDLDSGNAVIYCCRTVREWWGIQNKAAVKGGGGLTWETVDGKPVLMFMGIPVRRVDQMLTTEAVVS